MSDYDAYQGEDPLRLEIGRVYLSPAGCPVRVLAVEVMPANMSLHPGEIGAKVEYTDDDNSYGYGAGTVAWFPVDALAIRCASCGDLANLDGYCESCDVALYPEDDYDPEDETDDYGCWWCPECGEPEYNPSPNCRLCYMRQEYERCLALDTLYADVLPPRPLVLAQITPGAGGLIPF